MGEMAGAPKPVVWVDGRIEPQDRAVLRADDSAFAEGRGCYTTARVVAGHPRFADRHVARLLRAARELGIGELPPDRVHLALVELSKAAFGDGDGVVRIQASRDGSGAQHIVGVPRGLGLERPEWSAIVVPLSHDGGGLAAGLKVSSRLTMALAGDAARAAGVDEALLLDGAGRLVEGSRSNIFVAGANGPLATPPTSSGAVEGIARGVLLERVPEIEVRPIAEAELRSAVEIVAANAVRGACAITRLDDRAVGEGGRGPWTERLASAFARD